MRRAILLALLCTTAALAAMTGTARATTFSCSGPWPAPNLPNLSVGYVVVANMRASGVTCTGGTGNGWQMQPAVQYKDANGTWVYAAQDGSGNTLLMNMPAGIDDCDYPFADHYTNGVDKPLYAFFGGEQCVGNNDGSQYDAYLGDNGSITGDVYDQSGHDLSVDGTCSHGIQAWRIKYKGTDAGDSSNTDSNFGGQASC